MWVYGSAPAFNQTWLMQSFFFFFFFLNRNELNHSKNREGCLADVETCLSKQRTEALCTSVSTVFMYLQPSDWLLHTWTISDVLLPGITQQTHEWWTVSPSFKVCPGLGLLYLNMGSQNRVRSVCGLLLRCRTFHMCRWWKYVREVAKGSCVCGTHTHIYIHTLYRKTAWK